MKIDHGFCHPFVQQVRRHAMLCGVRLCVVIYGKDKHCCSLDMLDVRVVLLPGEALASARSQLRGSASRLHHAVSVCACLSLSPHTPPPLRRVCRWKRGVSRHADCIFCGRGLETGRMKAGSSFPISGCACRCDFVLVAVRVVLGVTGKLKAVPYLISESDTQTLEDGVRCTRYFICTSGGTAYVLALMSSPSIHPVGSRNSRRLVGCISGYVVRHEIPQVLRLTLRIFLSPPARWVHWFRPPSRVTSSGFCGNWNRNAVYVVRALCVYRPTASNRGRRVLVYL